MSQTTKKVSIFTGIAVPALMVISTIILFFVLRPADTKWHLLIFNLLYMVFLELVFFAWLGFLYMGNKVNNSPVFKIASGNTALYYIIVGLIIMLVYNLGLRNIPLQARYYYMIILAITLIWVVVGAIVLRIGGGKTAEEQATPDQIKAVNKVVSQMTVLSSRYSTLQSIHGAEGENNVDRLLAEFKGLNPVVAKNEASMNKLNTIITELDGLLDEAEAVSDDNFNDISDRIKLYIKKNIGKVEQIKTNV